MVFSHWLLDFPILATFCASFELCTATFISIFMHFAHQNPHWIFCFLKRSLCSSEFNGLTRLQRQDVGLRVKLSAAARWTQRSSLVCGIPNYSSLHRTAAVPDVASSLTPWAVINTFCRITFTVWMPFPWCRCVPTESMSRTFAVRFSYPRPLEVTVFQRWESPWCKAPEGNLCDWLRIGPLIFFHIPAEVFMKARSVPVDVLLFLLFGDPRGWYQAWGLFAVGPGGAQIFMPALPALSDLSVDQTVPICPLLFQDSQMYRTTSVFVSAVRQKLYGFT